MTKAEELGRAIKRKTINRAKDVESAEEIKEYVYKEYDVESDNLTYRKY